MAHTSGTLPAYSQRKNRSPRTALATPIAQKINHDNPASRPS